MDHDPIMVFYVYDKDTDIVYFYTVDEWASGLSVYYNKDGVPMTYKEFEKVHMKQYHK